MAKTLVSSYKRTTKFQNSRHYRDVVLGLGPWLSLRTKPESLVLALALRLEASSRNLSLSLKFCCCLQYNCEWDGVGNFVKRQQYVAIVQLTYPDTAVH